MKVKESNRNDLVVELREVSKMLDVDLPENTDLIVNYVIQYYPNLQIEEIKKSFELLLAGHYEIKQRKFGLRFITETLNEYVKQNRIKPRQTHHPEDYIRNDYTKEQKYNIVRDGLLEKHTEWEGDNSIILSTFYYDWCIDNHIKMIEDKTYKDYLEQGAKRAIRGDGFIRSPMKDALLKLEREKSGADITESKRIYLEYWFNNPIIIPEWK